MDQLDRKILKLLQNNFPITRRPFMEIASELGISEYEVLDRVKKLKKDGIIRRIGGIFDSRKLGYKSTLCAMSVPTERLNEVKQIVNSYTGVTHNYLRDHKLNMWFTLIAPSQEDLERIITEISEKTGLTVRTLPAIRLFKIKVKFQIPEGEDNFAESAR